MARKRWKRKSGYITPQPTVSKKDLMKYDLFLNKFYDDWQDWRDGFRDWLSDFKTIKRIHHLTGRYLDEKVVERRIRMNRKQKRLMKRRRIRKVKYFSERKNIVF